MPTNTVYQYFPEINPSNSTLALWYPFTIQLKRGPPPSFKRLEIQLTWRSMRRLFSNYRDALTSALQTCFHIFAFSTKCRDQKDFELHATLITTDPQGVQRAQNGRRSQLRAICNLSFHLPLASFCFLLSFSCSCSIFTIFAKS